MLLGAFLELLAFAAAVFAPLLALIAVWLVSPEPVGSRLLAWLGLTTSIVLLTSLPVYAVFIAAYGSAYSTYYAYVPLLGVAGAVLGMFLWTYNRDRLVHGKPGSRRLSYACLLFVVVVAAAPLPWLWGAQMYLGGGEFAGEYPAPPGDVFAYLLHVVPLALAVSLQAWVAARCGNERQSRQKTS